MNPFRWLKDFLEAFLLNVGPALAAGLAQEPYKGCCKGLGEAMRKMEEYNQKQFEKSIKEKGAM